MALLLWLEEPGSSPPPHAADCNSSELVAFAAGGELLKSKANSTPRAIPRALGGEWDELLSKLLRLFEPRSPSRGVAANSYRLRASSAPEDEWAVLLRFSEPPALSPSGEAAQGSGATGRIRQNVVINRR